MHHTIGLGHENYFSFDNSVAGLAATVYFLRAMDHIVIRKISTYAERWVAGLLPRLLWGLRDNADMKTTASLSVCTPAAYLSSSHDLQRHTTCSNSVNRKVPIVKLEGGCGLD